MGITNIGYLKVDLQSRGVRMMGDRGRAAGAGPAAGKTFLFGGTQANVPTQSWFVSQSPYSVETDDGRHFLKKYDERIIEVCFPSPRFYDLRTKDGVPYRKIALLHGKDCLATTLVQTCIHWNTPRRCKFCAIELSLDATVVRKKTEQLAEVAIAAKEMNNVSHVTITTGTTKTPDKGIKCLGDAARAIKQATNLPVHVQFEPPEDPRFIEELDQHGVDTAGIHIESFDKRVLSEVAPCKAGIGMERYIKAWKKAVEIFGENQVSSYIIAGLGEHDDSIIRGSDILIELGVYPFIVPLRPIPGTELEMEKPPGFDRMKVIYEEVASMLHDANMSWRRNKAGCVRCGACSALADFERLV
jgi:radical SAM protein (TIGR04043 family)